MSAENKLENALAVRNDGPVYVAPDADRGDLTWDPLARGYGWRLANELASSTLVPKHFQRQPGDVMIALELAKRMRMPPLQMLQSVYVVYGRPGLAAQFLIGLARAAGEAIAWEVTKLDPPMVEFERRWKEDNNWRTAKAKMPNLSVVAFFRDHPDDRTPPVTTELAIAEGWTANGKYLTMAELMLRYRAAAWLVRLYLPNLSLGLQTVEEIEDVAAAEMVVKQPAIAPPRTLAGALGSTTVVVRNETGRELHRGELVGIKEDGTLVVDPPQPAPAPDPEPKVSPELVDAREKLKALLALPDDDPRRARLKAYGTANQIRRWGGMSLENTNEAIRAAEEFPGLPVRENVLEAVRLSERVQDLSGEGLPPWTTDGLANLSDAEVDDLVVELREQVARWEQES